MERGAYPHPHVHPLPHVYPHPHQHKHRHEHRHAPGPARTGSEILAGQMAASSAAIQAIAGLATVVLGILAIVGINPQVLSLVALLTLGVTLLLTGNSLSRVVSGFMRPMATRATAS